MLAVREAYMPVPGTALQHRCDIKISLLKHVLHWGTGIRGLMRGMATLPQGNQELLVVRDKVGRPQVSLG